MWYGRSSSSEQDCDCRTLRRQRGASNRKLAGCLIRTCLILAFIGLSVSTFSRLGTIWAINTGLKLALEDAGDTDKKVNSSKSRELHKSNGNRHSSKTNDSDKLQNNVMEKGNANSESVSASVDDKIEGSGDANLQKSRLEDGTDDSEEDDDGHDESGVSIGNFDWAENSDDSWKGFQSNRAIALVHLGKAGGQNLKKTANSVLSQQIKYTFHMWVYDENEMKDATNYLFVLRHPVERIISTYRYSHPAKCLPSNRKQRPWSCHLIDNVLENIQSVSYRVWAKCFPSASMENFAQVTSTPLPPFINSHSFATGYNNATFHLSPIDHKVCRTFARDMVHGDGPDQPAPHMFYNYYYYQSRTIEMHPEKEVFGIRTEHELEDFKELDKAIGGTGEFPEDGRVVSHGSETYHTSDLSTQAYHKLCCVLHEEIETYQKILAKVVNLSRSAKEDSMVHVFESCGITTTFSIWQDQCRKQMKMDEHLYNPVKKTKCPPSSHIWKEKQRLKRQQEQEEAAEKRSQQLTAPKRQTAPVPVVNQERSFVVTQNNELTKSLPQLITAAELPSHSIKNDWIGYVPNRTIAMVHVGKAGGLTLRASTSLLCRLNPTAKNKTEEEKQPCIDRHFKADAVLSRQIKYYFHMWGYDAREMKSATSYLFLLRNPIDRIISAFRYSHPANCNDQNRKHSPWGCHIKKKMEKPSSDMYKIWVMCFPTAAMEYFAQVILGPLPAFPAPHIHSNKTVTLTVKEHKMCRTFARGMVAGDGPELPSPHMFYNYHFYMSRTIKMYPEKEVFGIRTENEWEDLRMLDAAIGGAGEFRQDGRVVSHGSENYRPSPLTPEAYHKLCCILHEEIENYRELLSQVVNLNVTEKEQCMKQVYAKCMITSSYSAWKQQCLHDLEQSEPLYNRRVRQEYPPSQHLPPRRPPQLGKAHSAAKLNSKSSVATRRQQSRHDGAN